MNSSKTAAKVEPARHWINGEWISSSNVAESVSPFHRGGARAVLGGWANRSGGCNRRRAKSL
jgi:hypothetical protein